MKQKNQVIVLIVLVVVAALVWTFEWNRQTPATQMVSQIQNYKPLAVENPQIRWGEMKRTQETPYKSNGRNPFSMIAPPTPRDLAEQRKLQDQAKNAPPPTPPPPPTVATIPPNIKYFGYGTVPAGSPRRAFFTDGDDVYIVPEGETLLGRYRILKIGAADLEFQEISSGLHGKMPLEEQAAPPSA